MTHKEIQELENTMKELSEMEDILQNISDKIYHMQMTIWCKIRDRGEE